MPYARAVADVSLNRRRTFRPAIEAASSNAFRSALVKKDGTYNKTEIFGHLTSFTDKSIIIHNGDAGTTDS